MSSVVGTRGQVTIAKSIRDALGVKPGWRSRQRLEGNRVVLEFIPPRHRRSLAGILEHATSVRIPSEEALHEAIEESWADDADARWRGDV